ncbi:MAG TPA: hypothetical protein VM287_06505 [Egibacteraceae bacterium]|nr:hypothetical protein [Egibacteraceae bacterium]
MVHPTVRHAGVLRGLLESAGTGGNLTSYADLAALGTAHGATLVSLDRDFGCFTGLRWRHPGEE